MAYNLFEVILLIAMKKGLSRDLFEARDEWPDITLIITNDKEVRK